MRENAALIRKTAYLLAFRRGLLGEDAPEDGDDLRPFARRGSLDLEDLGLLEREAHILVTGQYPEFGDQQTAIAGGLEPVLVPPEGLYPWDDWGHYRPEVYLGEGGMGWVFRARDTRLRRAVALKFFRSSLPEANQILLREARSQARIDHPHVAKVFEAGEQEGVSYLSMQYIHGPTLLKAVSSLGLRERVDVIRQVALGVHAAHRLGIVHRDLKPGNIMLERGGEGPLHAYVMDFGLARDLSDVPTGMSRVMGTPSYMSPEQIEGPSVLIGPHTDVFALGVTLYELLAERLPFESTSPTETMRRIVHEDPLPLRKVDPELPRELEAVVQRCLEKDVLKRYDSAQDLADELQRFLDGRPVLASPVSSWNQAVKRLKRNPLPAASAAAVILLAGGWLVYALATRSRERDLGLQVEAKEADLARIRTEMDALKTQQAAERLRSEALQARAAQAQTPAARKEAENLLRASQARERELAAQMEALSRRTPGLAVPPPPEPGPVDPGARKAAAAEPKPEGGTSVPPPRPRPDPEEPLPTPPQVLRQAPAVYPKRALSDASNPYRGRDMSVLVRLKVDAAGHPFEATVIRGVPGPWGYNEAAVESVLNATYAPAQRGGRPEAGVLDVRVNFRKSVR
jgi:serine/threonine protein kinase